MVILDTDHMSLIEHPGSAASQRLAARLEPIPASEVATTIVSYEEQARGWLSIIAQARTMREQIEAYRRLRRQLENYCRIQVLDFNEPAAVEFQSLVAAHVRIGSMDLRIAAVARSLNATLLSRNLRDFRKVPGLRVEDWTA
jgi:tRNA(fMet)-specific endonuclease VapC